MNPPLTRTDAWLLGAIANARESVSLPNFVNNADWMNRLIPTYDEVRYGLPRLIAAGYVTTTRDAHGEMRLNATPAARKIMAQVRASTLGGALAELARLVGASAYPRPEVEDRSLGPLDGFAREEWDAAVRRNNQAMKWPVRIIGALGAAVSIPIVAIARLVRSRDISKP